ncbi:MAG: adenylyl-sulfate kinase, partial [Pseudomonadota bacterium]
AGSVAPGDEIIVANSGKTAHVDRIVTADGDLERASAGDAVTLTLDAEIDIIRGDVIAFPQTRPEVSDQLAAHIIWMGEEPMLSGRSYLMRIGNAWTQATVSTIKHRLDVNTLQHHAARQLEMNEIAFVNLSLSKAVAVDPYEENREAGSFILVDRFSNATVAAGMVNFSLRRATNIHRESLAIDKAQRGSRLGQKPAVVWFTGLSASGKTTIAREVEKALQAEGRATYMLDGDNLRHGLNRDLGFTDADRVENIRRVGEVAKLMVDAGMVVLCSFISPFAAERRMVRDMLEDGEFVEIFVDTPLEVCMERDPKGLYAKAKAGEIKNFTGFDSPYERPESPTIHLETVDRSLDELSKTVLTTVLETTAPR